MIQIIEGPPYMGRCKDLVFPKEECTMSNEALLKIVAEPFVHMCIDHSDPRNRSYA